MDVSEYYDAENLIGNFARSVTLKTGTNTALYGASPEILFAPKGQCCNRLTKL